MKPSAENIRLAKEIHSRLDLLTVPNTAAVRAIRREFSARIASAAPESVVQLALHLLDQDSVLLRFFSLFPERPSSSHFSITCPWQPGLHSSSLRHPYGP